MPSETPPSSIDATSSHTRTSGPPNISATDPPLHKRAGTRDIGNFGFGFIILGPLCYVTLIAGLASLDMRVPALTDYWWLFLLLICSSLGWTWLLVGRSRKADA